MQVRNLAKAFLLVISMSSVAMAQLVPGGPGGGRLGPYPGGPGWGGPGPGGGLVPGPRPPMPPPGGGGWGGGHGDDGDHHDHGGPGWGGGDGDHHDHGGPGWGGPGYPPPPPGWGGGYPPPPRPMPPPPNPYPSPYPNYPPPPPPNPYPAPNPYPGNPGGGYRQAINLNVYRSVTANDRIDLTQYINLYQYRGYRIEQVMVQASTRYNSAYATLMINGFNAGTLQFMSQYSQQQSLFLSQLPMIGQGADSLVLYTSGDMTVENVTLIIR